MKELSGILGSSFILIQIDHIHIFALVEKYKAIADPGLRRIGKSIQNGHILTETDIILPERLHFFCPERLAISIWTELTSTITS